MSSKVTIVIVTYNALDYVEKCIESVLQHTDPKHEILVVDNASQQPTVSYLKHKSKEGRIKLILNRENRLWSPANNQGLKAASDDSEFLLLLNSDVEIFSSTWIDEILRPFDEYANVGITGTQFNFDPVKPMLGAIDGCCFMIKKSLIEKIGYLDENYPWNGAGSVYTYNAWKNGWFYYHIDNPELLVHYGKRSRINNNIQLKNQKVDKFTVLRKLGFKPRYALLAYAKYKLGILDINRYLKKYLIAK